MPGVLPVAQIPATLLVFRHGMVRKADGLKKSRPGQTSAGALTLVPDGTPFVGGAKAGRLNFGMPGRHRWNPQMSVARQSV
jgi:hypothetical protein